MWDPKLDIVVQTDLIVYTMYSVCFGAGTGSRELGEILGAPKTGRNLLITKLKMERIRS